MQTNILALCVGKDRKEPRKRAGVPKILMQQQLNLWADQLMAQSQFAPVERA
jgi:hypothetical protein